MVEPPPAPPDRGTEGQPRSWHDEERESTQAPDNQEDGSSTGRKARSKCGNAKQDPSGREECEGRERAAKQRSGWLLRDRLGPVLREVRHGKSLKPHVTGH